MLLAQNTIIFRWQLPCSSDQVAKW